MKGIFNNTPGIPPERIPPTIGLNIGKMDVESCKVIFWDLGGQVRMRQIWEKYYAEAHGMIFVIDSADPRRFEEARHAFETIRSHEQLRGMPVMILANKQDLPGALRVDDIESSLGFRGLGEGKFRVQPASCLTWYAALQGGIINVRVGCDTAPPHTLTNNSLS